MYQIAFTKNTPSDRIIIKAKVVKAPADILAKYQDKLRFENLCKSGCPNYGRKWSCPPYSPGYSAYYKDYPHVLLVLFWCTLDQFSYAGTEIIKVKAANSILKSSIDRFMRSLAQEFNGVMLSNGSCRLCRPCSRKTGTDGCKRPEEMRFSMEALGLDVSSISKDFFDHPLMWYKNKKAPLYSSVISCLLIKKEIKDAGMICMIRDYLSASQK